MALKFNSVLVGDSGVGKTTFLLRFAKGEFMLEHPSFVDHESKVVSFDGKQATMVVHDTAGQERFGQMTASIFRKVEGIILCYACNSLQSFDNLQRSWISAIEMYAPPGGRAIIATKCDLPRDQWQVTEEQGRQYAEDQGFSFFLSSSKSGTNIDEVMIKLASNILTSNPDLAVPQEENTVSLSTPAAKEKKKSCLI